MKFKRLSHHFRSENKKKNVEAHLKKDTVEWDVFNITVHHGWYKFGSAHSIFRHSGDFPSVMLNKRKEVVENIRKVMAAVDHLYRNTPQEHHESIVQKEIEKFKNVFHSLAKRYTHHFKTIISASTQTFITFNDNNLLLYFRRNIKDENEEMKFWKAICSDGMRRNIYDSDGVIKLISFYKIGEEELELHSVEQWYVYGKSHWMRWPGKREQGVFIQIDEDVIDGENGLLLKLIRDSNPAYEEKSDEELRNILKRSLLSQEPLIPFSTKRSPSESAVSPPNIKKELHFSFLNKETPKQREIDITMLKFDSENLAPSKEYKETPRAKRRNSKYRGRASLPVEPMKEREKMKGLARSNSSENVTAISKGPSRPPSVANNVSKNSSTQSLQTTPPVTKMEKNSSARSSMRKRKTSNKDINMKEVVKLAYPSSPDSTGSDGSVKAPRKPRLISETFLQDLNSIPSRRQTPDVPEEIELLYSAGPERSLSQAQEEIESLAFQTINKCNIFD